MQQTRSALQGKLSTLVMLLVLSLFGQVENVQAIGTRTPIDMMILIDNSCSMFPKAKILPGCTSWGSDVDFLRIKGADLFLARLGFGEPNEADYQVGVVSLGDAPALVSPLKPIQGARDKLAEDIAKPEAQSATKLVPALQMAYQELRESPARKKSNIPTLVMITDGIPWPPEGQSDEDIEKLVQANSDIPLFMMILKGEDTNQDKFEQYVKFWQGMQARYNHVYIYNIEDSSEIETTYNTIIAQIQDTIPAKANVVTPDQPLRVYASRYVRRLLLTIVHPSDQAKGTITVKDPRAKEVVDGEPGVAHFRGKENPVEIFSITSPRLDGLTQNYWNVITSQPVTVFVDREGYYKINFLNPASLPTDVNNVYQSIDRLPPRQGFSLKFNLTGEDGGLVTEPQPIRGTIIFPDGVVHALPVDAYFRPDPQGVYSIDFPFASEYPDILKKQGRFTFVVSAGSADEQLAEPIPIATARLLVDVGPAPYIQGIDPSRIECGMNTPSPVTVSLGDANQAVPGSLTARIYDGKNEVILNALKPGSLAGDVAPLCQPLVEALECSSQTDASFHLQIVARLPGEGGQLSINRNLPVHLYAPGCAPRPQKLTVTTTSETAQIEGTPTPVPDTDSDGWDDRADGCPDTSGVRFFRGCPPPRWAWLSGGMVLMLPLAGMVTYVGVRLHRRREASAPLEGFILVCRRGKPMLEPLNIRDYTGQPWRKRIVIGSDRRKADIFIEGMRPLEFAVIQQEDKTLLVDPKTDALRGTFRHLAPGEIPTSNPEITLWISLNLNVLNKINC